MTASDVCGIAGFSLAPDSGLEPTVVARVLLAGIANRGQDATGYAHRSPGGEISIVKDSVRLAGMIDRVHLPADTGDAILHVREFTKGRPGIIDNNHPIRWGRVTGVHNGHLENDDELFARYGQERSTARISVDSEAIMMLADVLDDVGDALGEVRGSAAVAVMYEDRPGIVLARRTRRPVVVGRAEGVALFASTREPIDLVARGAGLELEYEEFTDGLLVELRHGEEVGRRRFAVDYRYPGGKLPEYPRMAEQDRLIRFALAAFS